MTMHTAARDDGGRLVFPTGDEGIIRISEEDSPTPVLGSGGSGSHAKPIRQGADEDTAGDRSSGQDDESLKFPSRN
jgi:hypothetical protein